MKRLKISMLAVIGILLFFSIQTTFAQKSSTNSSEKYAEIKFNATNHNFGIFDVKNGMQTCYFIFTNTGNKDLQILNATASCGCTDPVFPKRPIAPGAKDSIKVTYDGTTLRPGVFRKVITVTTNAKVNNAYLYITGEMIDASASTNITKELDANSQK